MFLEQYNTTIHQLNDLSTYLSSADSPFAQLFIHPSHALTPADQSSLYGGPNATLDPPLRPVPGKGYADDRAAGYTHLADELAVISENTAADPHVKASYVTLAKVASDLRTTDEQVNFHLLESARAVEGIESSLARLSTLLASFRTRQARAREIVGSLRAGFEWDARYVWRRGRKSLSVPFKADQGGSHPGVRLDKGFSVVREAEEKGVDGDEEEEEDDEESDAEGSDDIPPNATNRTSYPSQDKSENEN